MPRTVVRNGYSVEQVLESIHAGTGTLDRRFYLLDRSYNRIRQLEGVTAAKVRWDGSQIVPRTLSLTMLHDDELLGVPWKYLIEAEMLVGMGRGRAPAQFPMGAYCHTEPPRDIAEPTTLLRRSRRPRPTAKRAETWTWTLGCQMHYLDDSTVGRAPFILAAGSQLDDAVRRVVQRNGFVDLSGVSNSIATNPSLYSASLRAGTTRTRWVRRRVEPNYTPAQIANYKRTHGGRNPPRTVIRRVKEVEPLEDQSTFWSHVARYLHQELGWLPPYFDLDNNRYVGRPHVNYADVSGSQVIAYRSGDGLLEPGVRTDPDSDEIFNRVIVEVRTASGTNAIGIADLDVLFPGHPYSHNVTGHYKDLPVTSSVAGTQAMLDARARGILFQHLRAARMVHASSRWHPAHDAHELVSLHLPDDPEYGTPQLLAEEGWSVDLFTGEMDHDWRHLYVAAA